jgi:hypothetical protein
MAHKTPVMAALYENRDQLKFRVREFDWPTRFGAMLFDFEVAISVGRSEHIGRGTHKTQEIAVEKACSEAIERSICAEKNISTVGVAVHPIQQLAIENAKQEFLERFYFNYIIDNQIALIPEVAPKCDTAINSLDAQFSFFDLYKADGLRVCMALFKHKGEAVCIGLGSDAYEQVSREKAFIEAFRNYVAFVDDPVLSSKLVDQDHNLWCANPEFIKRLRIVSTPEVPPSFPMLPLLQIERIDPGIVSVFKGFPVSVARAFI